MESRHQIEQRRQRIAREMLSLKSMKRGTLNEQFSRAPKKGREEPALRGPYYVFSRKEEGKTVSKRVSRGEVEQYRGDIERYHRFVELSQEFVSCSEGLGACQAQEQTLKKKPKSPSGAAKK